MTPQQPYPLVSQLIERFGDWLTRQRQLHELGALDAAEFKRMSRELGIAPDDLDALVRRGVRGSEELPRMLRALGFDEAAIAQIQAPQLLEMRHACAGCAHKTDCNRDLAARTAPQSYQSYCANAGDIAHLSAARE